MAYLNGRIPSFALATTYLYYPGTTNGRRLLLSAAPSAEAMALAFYLEFDKPLYATDGYRDYATQVELKDRLGPYAAKPGTSNHGWGKALDLASNVNSFTSAEHKWLRANAHRWGWIHPAWAHDGNNANGMNEAWHWEYVGGGATEPRILRPRTGRGEVGLGSTGDRVKRVQGLLNDRLSGRDLAADGDFGLGTAVAVARFQKARRLTVTGRVGTATLRELEGRDTPEIDNEIPTTAERVRAIQRAIHTNVVNGAWGPETDRRVVALRAASVLGGVQFPHGVKFAQNVVGAKMDGDWGPKSAAAHTETVKKVQEALGIKPDGIYGPYTGGKLSILKRKAV